MTISGAELRDFFDYAVNQRISEAQQESEEKMLTTEEACKVAKVSRPTLHRWKTAGIIPYVKIGKSVRYRHSDLMAVLNNARKKEGRA